MSIRYTLADKRIQMDEAAPDQDRLLDEAIDLIIRYQGDPENQITGEMIRTWRLRSPQHESVWAGVSRIHGASGKILTEKRRIERMESLGLTRRNLMIGGLTILGAASATWAFGPGLVLQARADHFTAAGEKRQVMLPDGSLAVLGPQSAIGLDFSENRRIVRLLAGMSFFDVVRNESRPFSVLCETLSVTALGTGFDVSSDGGVVSVAVDHGLVAVQEASLLAGEGIRLGEGQWITLDSSSGHIERGQRQADQIASWRDNLIIAEREPVSTLVARISRWMPGRVVIADPSIGGRKISGVFDLNDPAGALEAVVHPAGGHVRRISSFLTVISPL